MILKYWYWFSFLLLVYNLSILNDESNIVYYNRIKEERANDSFEASICFPLASVLQLMSDEVRTKLEESETVLVPHLMRLATNSLNARFRIELDELYSYFANNHTCFAVNGKDLDDADYFGEIDFKVSRCVELKF